MAAPHAFLDVLANVQIRDAYLAGRISIILTPDLETILWANGAGARFMGMRTVAETIGVDSGFDRLTRHQIEAGLVSTKPVRVSGVPRGESFLVNETDLAPLGRVVFLRSVQGQADPEGNINLIQGLSDETTAAAVFDLAGHVIQASVNFDLNWFAQEELGFILNEAHREGRVKKRLLQKNPSQPIGVLALSQEPTIFLVIAAREEIVQEKAANERRNFVFDPTILPLYFGWRIDARGRFKEVSEELRQAVGARYSDIIDKDFSALAEAWDMDGDATLRALFRSHNVWGGYKIYWPVENTQARVEITFFALPVYSRAREFVGFRGFAIIDAMKADAQPPVSRSYRDALGNGLTAQEHEAFSIIGRMLQADLQEKEMLKPSSKNEADSPDEMHAETEKQGSFVKELSKETGVPGHLCEPEKGKDISKAAPLDVNTMLITFSSTHLHIQPSCASDFAPLAQWGQKAGAKNVRADWSQVELTLLQHMPLAILVYRDEKVLFVSEKLLQITGFPTLESFRVHGVLSKVLRDWLPRNILQGLEGEVLSVCSQRRAISWFDDKPAFMLSFLPDETPRLEQLNHNLQDIQNKAIELSALFNLISDGVLVIDMHGTIHSLNEGAARIFKRPVEAIRGQNFKSFFAADEGQNLDRFFALALEKGYRMQPDGGALFIGQGGAQESLTLHVNFVPMETEKGIYLLVRDVSDLHSLSRKLKQTSQQAGEVRQKGSQHLAQLNQQLNHQIRTPLTAILGLSQLILTEKYGPLNNDRYRAYLRDIVNSSDHILQLLQYFSEAGAQSGKEKKFKQERLTLTPILNEVLAQINPQANQKQIFMRTSVSADLAAISGDGDACRKIIRTLLNCSLYLTPMGGQIIISGQNHVPEGVLLRIRDSGVGISPQDKAIIMKSDPPLLWSDDDILSPQGENALPIPIILAQIKKLAAANGARFRLHSEPGKGMLVEIFFALG